MALTWPDKDPDDIWDVGFTISGLDDSLSIVSSVPTVVKGTVSVDNHAVVPGTMTSRTRLSGGTLGETCEVRIRTTMSDGERFDQTMMFRITER